MKSLLKPLSSSARRLVQGVAGKPLTGVGDGTQSRDFTLVAHAVDAFVRAADSHIDGEILNVESGATYSVDSLVTLLARGVVDAPSDSASPTAQLPWRIVAGRIEQC
jgi:UDP-glucose 4-epimerase